MKRTVNTFIFVIIASLFAAISIHSSFALPPSACDNRVDGRIISMKINSEGRTIDILSKQGTTFDASIQSGYSVKLVLLAQSAGSSHGKSSFWITNTAYGFSSGTCINNPHLSIKGVQMGQAVDGLVQNVKWGSWPNTEQVLYKVRWH
jgi:hypothetical protein